MKRFTLALCMALTAGLTSAAYAEGHGAGDSATKAADVEAGKQKATTVCVACHGVDGNSLADAFPKVAGQQSTYIVNQLKAFKAGARKNPLMAPQAAGLTEQDMINLAAYYSQQTMSQGSADEAAAKQGEALYRGGNADKNLPACMACHGPSGSGIAPSYPRLGGQYAKYLETRIAAIAQGEHSGNANGQMMQDVAKRMSAKEIKAVSGYIAGLH
ncbi:c-type cytochrome [Candidatus Venteria ishoeyi]|uniref:Cytochrome c4 n=1 Tax=Candidatus Venteria ishoeyi TaxID=1899563 RepID=A0A1H6F9Z6_9GAMM|nr:c-type cytochrome [Candidatus Venteria ishoeyi]MDM8546345.1 c-type cytochrome [Candidatus Venteria ishoeyi]SEH06930.1 Cytochrome c4 precursor [Candidatus Venteria ishoeyi]